MECPLIPSIAGHSQESGARQVDMAAYLTPADVASMLQVSAKSVYRWAEADPSMPVLRIAGTMRFPRERLERWLRDREQGRARARRPSRKQMLGAAQVAVSLSGGESPRPDCANP